MYVDLIFEVLINVTFFVWILYAFILNSEGKNTKMLPVSQGNGVFLNLVGERVDSIDDDRTQDEHTHKHY